MTALPRTTALIDVEPTVTCSDTGGAEAPVLLIHGLGASRLYWTETARLLAADRRVVAIDLPGFGDSPPGEVFSLEGAAERVNATIESYDLEGCYLVGHSLGGAVALDAARRATAHVRGVVLVNAHMLTVLDILRSPVGGFRHPKEAVSLAALVIGALTPGRAQAARATASSAVLRTLLYWPVLHRPAKMDEDVLKSALAANSNRNVLNALREVRDLDVEQLIADQDQDVFAVWGADDRLIGKQDEERVRDLTRAIRVREIDECGHWPMLERPEEFVDVLRSVCV